MRPSPALTALAALLAVTLAQPAAARTLTFQATLDGVKVPTLTGSPAGGKAIVRVDTTARRVSIELTVGGITLDQLADAMVVAPTGPVRFHDHRGADDNDAVLAVPYGGGYRAARGGFAVSARDLDFAQITKPFDTGLSFDEFVDALRSGRIVIEVHTDRFPDGEIGGKTMVK